jgi:signal transduction histidine kinase
MTGPRQVSCCSIWSPGTTATEACASDLPGAIWFSGFPFAFFHSIWARLFYVAAGLFVVWFVYRLRIRRTETALSLRFDEQLSERTRVARELHDTLLQTIEASKMVADDALDPFADPVRVRRAMSRLSDWLGQATEEGQAALNSLRTANYEGDHLAASFRRAAEECLVGRSVEFAVSVTGRSMEMYSMVGDEVYRIGYEAISNACKHPGVSQLSVALIYGPNFCLQVTANGKGIDHLFAEQGKDEYLGPHGIRNRAERMGGKLSVISSASSGTELTLVVLGRIIFQREYPPLAGPLVELWRGHFWSRKGRSNKKTR